MMARSYAMSAAQHSTRYTAGAGPYLLSHDIGISRA